MRRRIAAALAAAVLPLALGACTSVKAGLGTRDGVCFASLPQAARAVGADAHLAGVRYLSPASLLSAVRKAKVRHIVPPDALVDMGRRGACLIGYRGQFAAEAFPNAWRPERGPYRFAIVVVRQQDHQIVGIVLVRRPPLRFFHLS